MDHKSVKLCKIALNSKMNVTACVFSAISWYAFSSNGKPTLEAIPDPSVPFGLATEVSQNDILRLNRLYGCSAGPVFSLSKTMDIFILIILIILHMTVDFVDVKMKFLPALALLVAASAWAEEVTEELSTSEKIDRVNRNAGTRFKRYAFSSNGKPTLEAIPDPSVQFGLATEVSQNDIIRLNRLYGCPAVTTSDPSTVTTTTTRPTTSPSSALMAEASHILFVVGFWCSVWYLHPHRVTEELSTSEKIDGVNRNAGAVFSLSETMGGFREAPSSSSSSSS
ncbi:uncharacterized protein V6R79_024933 [Siganus canaliculatus]